MSSNSYNVFLNNNSSEKNKRNPTIYSNNNLIFLHVIEKVKTTSKFSAFCLRLSDDPNFTSNNSIFEKAMNCNTFNNFIKKYDIAEVLRGDYSKMFFDIDAHIDEEHEAFKAFEQIEQMIQIIKKDGIDCRLCGIVEFNEHIKEEHKQSLKNLFEKYEDEQCDFDNYAKNPNGHVYVLPNKYLNTKSISAHLFVCGCYFSRSSLHNIFKNFNSANKIQNSAFSNTFDFTVYKEKQQILRFCLSGKAIINRPPNPNFDSKFCSSICSQINDFVATKTESDVVLISGETLEKLKTFVDSMKFKESSEELKKQIKNKTNGIEEDLTIKKPRILFSSQCAWYFDLCKMIAYDVLENCEIKDSELLTKYDKENFYYFSNSQQRRVRNVSAINSAIDLVRRKGPLEFCKNFKIPNNIRLFKDDVFKYSFEKFKSTVSYGVNIQTLATLINGTFCFFRRSDEKKRADEYVAYINSENEITVDELKRWTTSLSNSGFKIKLNRVVDGVKFSIKCSLLNAFEWCQCYKNEIDDFDVYTLKQNVLNLYDKPTTAENCELCDEWKTIVELLATEINDKFEQVVNVEKYEYILNWFAYVLQHPESKNKTLLYITGLQGIGKNVLTDCICKFLNNFGVPNVNIKTVCGNFNGLVANKKLCCINELEISNYSDKIKTLIEDEQAINVKYGAQYFGSNKCNYVIFSNHFNTNIIQKGDRRFAFINSTALPEDKAFYASLFDGDEYKPEIMGNLINHLLSRDLTNYKNHEAPLFDKLRVYEDMDLKRSPAYLEAIEIMKQRGNKPIELNELIEMLNERKEENEDLRPITITIRTIRKILGFNDTDDYKIAQNKTDKKFYLVDKYYKSTASKEAMIKIMKERNNEKLEVKEALNELAKVGFTGITTRTLRKTLNFTTEDKYEIRKSNGNSFIVYIE